MWDGYRGKFLAYTLLYIGPGFISLSRELLWVFGTQSFLKNFCPHLFSGFQQLVPYKSSIFRELILDNSLLIFVLSKKKVYGRELIQKEKNRKGISGAF